MVLLIAIQLFLNDKAAPRCLIEPKRGALGINSQLVPGLILKLVQLRFQGLKYSVRVCLDNHFCWDGSVPRSHHTSLVALRRAPRSDAARLRPRLCVRACVRASVNW